MSWLKRCTKHSTWPRRVGRDRGGAARAGALGRDPQRQQRDVAQQHAEVVARPKVITADKSPAVIESGTEIPYQEATSSGATSTSFKDAVLSLEVTPQITPDDRIIMQLNVKQDSVGQVFNGVPSIDTNEIETEVLVDNGQTLARLALRRLQVVLPLPQVDPQRPPKVPTTRVVAGSSGRADALPLTSAQLAPDRPRIEGPGDGPRMGREPVYARHQCTSAETNCPSAPRGPEPAKPRRVFTAADTASRW